MEYAATALHDAIESLGWTGAAVVRLLLAVTCGGLIGLEREVRGRQAGFRTHLLVCLGSAVVMLVSIRVAYYPWPAAERNNARAMWANHSPLHILMTEAMAIKPKK